MYGVSRAPALTVMQLRINLPVIGCMKDSDEYYKVKFMTQHTTVQLIFKPTIDNTEFLQTYIYIHTYKWNLRIVLHLLHEKLSPHFSGFA